MTPTVVLTGAEKGGVGKTTVARALMEYLAAARVWVRAVDTAAPRGDLIRFHPDRTVLIDLGAPRVEDSISSLIRDTQCLVVDAGPGQFGHCLEIFDSLQRKMAFAGRPFRFVVAHVAAGNVASLEEIEAIGPHLPCDEYILVRNHPNGADAFGWAPDGGEPGVKTRGDLREIAIAKLNELAFEQVDAEAAMFADFAADRGRNGRPADWSFVLRSCVRSWLAQVFGEFDRAGLAQLLQSGPAIVREA